MCVPILSRGFTNYIIKMARWRTHGQVARLLGATTSCWDETRMNLDWITSFWAIEVCDEEIDDLASRFIKQALKGWPLFQGCWERALKDKLHRTAPLFETVSGTIQVQVVCSPTAESIPCNACYITPLIVLCYSAK